jgi:hypothetical protein
MKKFYRASIFIDVYEDDYEKGEGKHCYNNEIKTEKLNTIKELYEEIEELTDTVRKDWNVENINDYTWASEIWACNLVKEEQYGDSLASEEDIELWKKGELKLYIKNFQICVSEVTKSPVDKEILKKALI